MADEGKLQKKDKDYAPILDAEFPKIEATAKQGKLLEALEQLMVLEKQTRMGADLASTTRVLCLAVKLCFDAKDWKTLNEYIILLTKKHGQLKQALSQMVLQCIEYIDKTPDMKTKLELIDTLRTVTEGKIYVEVERARLTRMLAKIKEDEGKVVEAADILQELQVETYGSMEKSEKTDFILEQMRLLMAKKDYTRTQIISRKINTKFFKEEENQILKLRYYALMIQYATHEEEYLNICKYWREIFDTPSIQSDPVKCHEAIEHFILYAILSPHDNEQNDLIHRISKEPRLREVPIFAELLKNFIVPDLTRWAKIDELYGAGLRKTPVFDHNDERGVKRWKDLQKRVVEHNLRVVAKYYTRITTKRLTQLLDLPEKDVEEVLSKLVVSKVIYAKMDRPAGLISFTAPKDPNEVLNEYSGNISTLLELVEKTTHLIQKEEMVGAITKVI